ncbi:class I SAM-dependent methyltransferase [Enterovirga sp. CN4-39]|uniref:class I SAM-dependent methyltransferase n=1 Tax=Enterovirga sp. CN4-39 TaxID=3400910 RepID=UPI003C10D82A
MTFLSDEAIRAFQPSVFSPAASSTIDDLVQDIFRRDLPVIEKLMPEPYFLDRLASAIYYRVPRLTSLGYDLSSMTVLELGCGRGLKAIPWSHLFHRYYGVDLDTDAIGLARELAAACGRENLHFLDANAADVMRMPRAYGIEDRIDCVIMYAVIEHLTLDERRIVLAAIRELLAGHGLLIVSETPNRLIPHDSHSTFLHFFQSLPTELALQYIARSPRIGAKEVAGGDDPCEALYRFGMAASYHEFELFLADGEGRLPTIKSDGWCPWPAADEPIRRDEAELVRYLKQHGPLAHAAFARYWLEMVFDFGADPATEMKEPIIRCVPSRSDRSGIIERPACWTLDLVTVEGDGHLSYDLVGEAPRLLQIDLRNSQGGFGLHDAMGRKVAEFDTQALGSALYKRWHDRAVLDLTSVAFGNEMSIRPLTAGSRLAVECLVSESLEVET